MTSLVLLVLAAIFICLAVWAYGEHTQLSRYPFIGFLTITLLWRAGAACLMASIWLWVV